MLHGPDGNLRANMTGANSHNTDHGPPIQQCQSSEISVVRQDNPPQAVCLVQKFTVRPPMPSLFFDIENVKPSGTQERDDLRMDILVREPPTV